jgi:hypothetical protein
MPRPVCVVHHYFFRMSLSGKRRDADRDSMRL